jgi:AcrR family transcriptional regulator
MKPLETEGPHAGSNAPGSHESRDPALGPRRTPRRERELMRHRDELLRATDRVLRSKSLNELTIVDIAAESEFSVGYIYKLFPNKEEILATLIRTWLHELRHIVDESLSRYGTWQDRAGALAGEMLAWLDRGAMYTAGAPPSLRDFAAEHPAVAPDLAHFVKLYRTNVDRLFYEAVRAGRLAEPRPGTIARTFRALLAGYSMERMEQGGPREPVSELAEHIVRVVKSAFAVKGGGA